MRGVQLGWFREERYSLVVPVNEDMACGGEDVGGATLQKCLSICFGGEKGRD